MLPACKTFQPFNHHIKGVFTPAYGSVTLARCLPDNFCLNDLCPAPNQDC